ncbi:M23 family metallopeptidase [Sphingomonas sp. GCM10030256]|uniref:M23 family metallopeptidase n=1 Tax=Sphingomonas sp. GCM10030256 TaxID=3273427 RepID=UPI0036222720
MYHAGGIASFGHGATALSAPAFGLRARRCEHAPFELVVDLGTDLFSRRWWRGAATLLLMSSALAMLAPGFEPLAGGRPEPLGKAEAEQLAAVGIAPISARSATGMAMAETAAVQPLASAPERTTVQLFATLQEGDSLGRLLLRNGAAPADAAHAQALVRGAAPTGLAPGTSVSILLGEKVGSARSIERVSLRANLGLNLVVRRTASGLALTSFPVKVNTTPLRIRGRVGDGLYWSLRSAGASPQAASEYLRALATQVEVGSEVMPQDRFDLVVANRRSDTGESMAGPLLYAGLERSIGGTVQLLRWPAGKSFQWIDAATIEGSRGVAARATAGLMWPVQARITSGFGLRVHPILRFARMHRGIDFGARWGTPIVAAADGQVARAGWAGGYGRQVRVAHAGGLLTSYSHMSRIVAEPGTLVRAGQLIGYVGSSGLSTGPHLHYEVYRGGVAVNPMGVRFAPAAPMVDQRQVAAVKARLRALLSVGGT